MKQFFISYSPKDALFARRLRRSTYLLFVVFTVAYIALFIWLNTALGNLAVDSIKDQMLALVETGMYYVNSNVDEYEALVVSHPAGDNTVYESDNWRTQFYGFLSNVKSSNKNIRTNFKLYAIARGKDDSEYLIVASTDTSVNYKDAFPSYGSASVQIAGMERTTVSTQVVADSSGRRISACSPIINSQAVSIGALCVDFDSQILIDTRKEVTSTLIPPFQIIYASMIVMVFLAERWLQRSRDTAQK